MKKILFSFSLLAITFAGFGASAQVPTDGDFGALNLKKLNAVIDTVVQGVLLDARQEPNPVFEKLSLKIDENATDLNSEDHVRLQTTLSATINRSFWSKQATTLELQLGGAADRATQLAETNVQATLRTEVLPLTQYLVTSISQEFCGVHQPDPWDADFHYVDSLCAKLKALSPVKSVRGLAEGLVAVIEVTKEYNLHKLSLIEETLKTDNDQNRKHDEALRRMTQEDQTIIERLDTEWTSSLRNSPADAFDLKVQTVDIAGYGVLHDLELYADGAQVRVNLHFTSQKLKDIDSYFELKPIAQGYLLQLQEGDADSLKGIREAAKFYAEVVKDLLANGSLH